VPIIVVATQLLAPAGPSTSARDRSRQRLRGHAGGPRRRPRVVTDASPKHSPQNCARRERRANPSPATRSSRSSSSVLDETPKQPVRVTPCQSLASDHEVGSPLPARSRIRSSATSVKTPDRGVRARGRSPAARCNRRSRRSATTPPPPPNRSCPPCPGMPRLRSLCGTRSAETYALVWKPLPSALTRSRCQQPIYRSTAST
jgi:hypothetical protein